MSLILGHGFRALIFPLGFQLLCLLLRMLGAPVPLESTLVIAVVLGFFQFARATGLHAAWLAAVYAPAMYWLVALMTGLVSYFSGIGLK